MISVLIYHVNNSRNKLTIYLLGYKISQASLLEKMVHKHLYAMLESHDLPNDPHQFGFRRKRSTTSLLMTAVHDWAAGLNLSQSQTTHCLFLDMSGLLIVFHTAADERLLLNEAAVVWSGWCFIGVV